MSDWKYGTTLRRVPYNFIVFVIACNETNERVVLDEDMGGRPGEWSGVTIADPGNATNESWYPIDKTCWVEEPSDGVEWEVLE